MEESKKINESTARHDHGPNLEPSPPVNELSRNWLRGSAQEIINIKWSTCGSGSEDIIVHHIVVRRTGVHHSHVMRTLNHEKV